ncbi:hypothetical protein W04_1567 [Pseudoalteromonas sp. SW0106-04]|nr:hypothetical protein W04_1567 [Pseudoalteromonas sp. SW0106-04]
MGASTKSSAKNVKECVRLTLIAKQNGRADSTKNISTRPQANAWPRI